MDRDLVVRGAEGESILRLPWFDEELFVGRQLPDIDEIPSRIRSLAVESYRNALSGERTEYGFTSYGHRYSVDAVPIQRYDGRIDFVIAVATPHRCSKSAVTASERFARGLDDAAALAEQRGNDRLREGRNVAAAAESHRAEKTRHAADRVRLNVELLRSCHPAQAVTAPPLSPRELEVLTLASHGFTYSEIAEHLVVAPATVKTHLAHIYSKFQVPDKAAAVAVALRHGLIE